MASPDSVVLRLTAKADSIEEAQKLIAPVESEIRTLVGQFIYGTDDDTLSSKAAELLKNSGLTIAAAESLTAGLFMAELADEPGISTSLKGGMVVYDETTKKTQLDIPDYIAE